MRAVLVHSPAVGPSTWRWVAEALTRRGHAVTVPDLRPAVATGDPAAFVAAALAPEADVVVGHSGAGPLVAGAGGRVVLVDAGFPAEGADPFVAHLRGLAVDGVLPPWSTWFGPDVVAGMVPDPARRAAVRADEPRVPLAFYEAPRPATTLPAAGGYVLLSEAYRPDAERAAAHGWTVGEVPTSHLGLVTHPGEVATAIEQAASARRSGR
ncbi:MAG TPA: hypothetical protein VFU19_20235 [Iamia sp.]|nr:hypothetical protein [Iamia sp.]